MDSNTIYMGIGAVALLGSLAVVRGAVVESLQKKKIASMETSERQRLESIIDGTVKIGSLERIYYREDHLYRDQQERVISVISAGTHILKLDAADSLQSRDYFHEKLFTARELAKSQQVDYFSLTGHSYFGRTGLAYALTFHRKLETKDAA